MLGAIVGDTVGSVYEFNNTRDYNFELFTPESIYTDDSVMSMAVAKWLLTAPSHSHETLEKIMSDFYEAFPCPAGGYGGGFLRWLRSPAPRRPYGSWGNGSAMRVSACGWFFDSLEETEKVAGISASITHNHPEGIKGAQATAACIWMARKGHSKQEIREYVSSTYGYDLSGTWESYHRTYHWEDSCQGTVPPAIVCFLESEDFEDAVRKAVSIGGDSDTLACITGSIAEAYYGGVPDVLVSPTEEKLPEIFRQILDEMKDRTMYGIRLPNPEIQSCSRNPKVLQASQVPVLHSDSAADNPATASGN